MKKSLFIVLLSAFSISLFAQHRAHHPGKLFKDLNLTEDQKRDMRMILENYKEQVKSIHASDLSKEETRAGMNELQRRLNADVETVLDEKQFAQWKANQQERKTHRKDRRENREALDLSDSQVSQLKEIKEQHLKQMKELRQQDLTPEERKQKALALRSQMESAVQQVLTPEQFEQWKAYRAHRDGHHRHGVQG